MKKLLLVPAMVALVMSQPCLASSSSSNGSVEFSVGGASLVGSVAFGSALVLSSPFIIVAELSEAADRNSRTVKVRDAQNREATLAVPKKAVDAAKLAPGDQLTVQQRTSGALLMKNNEPVAFIIPPQNAGLSKNAELKR